MAEARIEHGTRGMDEHEARARLGQLFEDSPIPSAERLESLHVFLRRQQLARLLMLDDLYRRLLGIPGSIVQCGVRWGGDLVTLASLRALHEPFHYSRRIVGFDTFAGLSGVSGIDQGETRVEDGQFGVSAGYRHQLEEILAAHEANAPLAHIRKFELVEGDVRDTAPNWVKSHPGELVACLYLDMDIHAPTLAALHAFEDRLVPGAVVVFDEITDRRFPGEAQAWREVQTRLRMRLVRPVGSTVTAFGIVGAA
jgi:hypothetical protein